MRHGPDRVEPTSDPIWESRAAEVRRDLSQWPDGMRAVTLVRRIVYRTGMTEGQARNVLAAAEARGLAVFAHGRWYAVEHRPTDLVRPPALQPRQTR